VFLWCFKRSSQGRTWLFAGPLSGLHELPHPSHAGQIWGEYPTDDYDYVGYGVDCAASAIAVGVDFNQDGFDDLLARASGHPEQTSGVWNSERDAGAAYVLFGEGSPRPVCFCCDTDRQRG